MSMRVVLVLCLILLGRAGEAQTAFRAGVLELEASVSGERELAVRVSNMSKLPSTLDSVTAELAPGCRYESAVGLVPPGEVRTIRLASRRQIASCNAPTLRAFKSGERLRAVYIPKRQPLILDRPVSPAPAVAPSASPRPNIPVRPPRVIDLGPSPSPEPSDSHTFKIRATGSVKGEPFAVDGDWVLRVER